MIAKPLSFIGSSEVLSIYIFNMGKTLLMNTLDFLKSGLFLPASVEEHLQVFALALTEIRPKFSKVSMH